MQYFAQNFDVHGRKKNDFHAAHVYIIFMNHLIKILTQEKD